MIGPIENNQPVRLDRARQPGTEAAGQDAPGSARRTDKVEISAQAREQAEALNREGLSNERIAEIRAKLADGSYDTPEVLESIARKIIEHGDV